MKPEVLRQPLIALALVGVVCCLSSCHKWKLIPVRATIGSASWRVCGIYSNSYSNHSVYSRSIRRPTIHVWPSLVPEDRQAGFEMMQRHEQHQLSIHRYLRWWQQTFGEAWHITTPDLDIYNGLQTLATPSSPWTIDDQVPLTVISQNYVS